MVTNTIHDMYKNKLALFTKPRQIFITKNTLNLILYFKDKQSFTRCAHCLLMYTQRKNGTVKMKWNEPMYHN